MMLEAIRLEDPPGWRLNAHGLLKKSWSPRFLAHALFLLGFVIPGFLDFKVLLVKATGAVFTVATGMCFGKQGPFVYISTCVGHLVARRFHKHRDNGRKMREIFIEDCLSRKITYRKLLQLPLHSNNVFVFLGVAGSIFGDLFCRLGDQLRRRGLMDAGLVLVQNGGMLGEWELEFRLTELEQLYREDAEVRMLGEAGEGEFDLSHFVHRTPLGVSAAAPMEYAALWCIWII
ncbi:uncharacterized protein MYCFIDRAFT_191957 [Pseudocercospora fijiensis CIRAD86]|uniref:Transmembrane protein n=1 Tax=Pseudocercospora fijiensis (strain CIRAD86) TaxID=383855 RepID=N1Q9I5_PSEFD|nr:uncharacterized protein MYCFIDRAFT_191957 [Pseudocercospora fijiensis CIRAD86]EME87553.1 hypothetical protein MYCFIDRAFT_191957 [Pseudocercospora fijiensis CIRAD86]